MRLIILLLMAMWYDSHSFGHVQVNSQKNFHVVTKRWNKLSKRQDDLGYLEQCSILQFWDKQIGRVNVLAFFDSSWQFSHRQAAMLRVLTKRFDKTGFDNIQFFAINAAPGEGRYVDRSEIEVEEQTWKQISPSEAEGVPPVVVSPEALIEAVGPDVYFIQDTRELQIWSKLRAFRDQILVIDRCGRLTYQVIVPWSILHFPYVKAAILSTYKDEPCGYCQFQESPFDITTTELNDTPSTPKESLVINVQTENSVVPTASEETSTLIVQTENNDTSSSSEEILTFIIRTGKKSASSIIEESSTLPVQTETTTTFDTSTYNPSDSYNDDFSNYTNNEYTDAYSNYTTPQDLESTRPDLETFVIEVIDKFDIDNITGQQIWETEIPTTTEISDSSTKIEEPRLKDSDEIEGLDARYVLKSRSTNGRSVSPNDGSQNHLDVIEINGEASGDQNSVESDFLIPIRIIMRAPHVDEYSDQTMKVHEYLVLKTDLPDYHGHLESPNESRSREENEEHEPVRKKAEAIRRTFSKDESPGLYGEVADYWRNFGNEQLPANTQSSMNDSEDDDEGDDDGGDGQLALEQDTNFKGGEVTPAPTILDYGKKNTENPYESPAVVSIEEIELSNGKVYDNNNSDYNEEVDVVEEEAKSKLIAHYSKLLPWLYYVLAK